MKKICTVQAKSLTEEWQNPEQPILLIYDEDFFNSQFATGGSICRDRKRQQLAQLLEFTAEHLKSRDVWAELNPQEWKKVSQKVNILMEQLNTIILGLFTCREKLNFDENQPENEKKRKFQ